MTYLDMPFDVKSEDITDDGVFSGYGSTFGGAPDSHGDVIKQGAFKTTLEAGGRNGTGISMLWMHDVEQPIGIWTELNENAKGLKVTGQLALDVQRGREAYILLKMKALSGLSIGWGLPRDADGNIKENSYLYDAKRKVRYINEVDLWEISPVTFPANIRATITQVKSIEEAKSERELEAILRESGLSKKAAQYLVACCWSFLRDAKEAGDIKNGVESILSEIKKVNASIVVANSLYYKGEHK